MLIVLSVGEKSEPSTATAPAIKNKIPIRKPSINMPAWCSPLSLLSRSKSTNGQAHHLHSHTNLSIIFLQNYLYTDYLKYHMIANL